MDLDDWFLSAHVDDYEVKCARCGVSLHASEAYVEEGDEWECEPCWERCEAKERIAARGLDFDVGT
jgi:hypothetical protein